MASAASSTPSARNPFAVKAIVTHLASVSDWLFLTPLALVAAAVLGRAGARLLVTMVLTIGLGICGFAAIYWTSSLELHYYVDNSVGRIVSSLAVLGASLFPLVVAE